MAALYGEAESVRELLIHVPSHLRSVYPASMNTAAIAELASEADLTPLHLASFSGSDDAVRDHQHITPPSTLITRRKG